MFPKKAKTYIPITAKKLEMDEGVVKAVVDFYFSRLRKSMSDLEFHRIQVEGLGRFNSMHNELTKVEMKYLGQLSHMTGKNPRQVDIRQRHTQDIGRIRRLKALIVEELKAKKAFKKKKHEHVRKDIQETQRDI